MLFAGNDNNMNVRESAPISVSGVASLAPVTPKEADFADAAAMNMDLNPVTPKEANFTEKVSFQINLTPVNPSTADFEELPVQNMLAPVTPAQAGFEE